LIVGDELYLVTDAGIASCLDAATGTLNWQQRLGGTYSASPVFAGGRIYFLAEQGATTVVLPGKQFSRIAVNALEGATLASIAVSGGSMFIRSDTHLYRIAPRVVP
jgi:outer membrane protein assembly factor BamB